MIMDCSVTTHLVDSWERGESIGAEGYASFLRHLEACASCSRRFAPLLPLIARDVGAAPRASLPGGFSDRVMERVAAGSLRFPARPPLPRHRRPATALVAAAAIVALGLGIAIGSKAGLGDSDLVVVRLVLDAPDARTVALAGDFNGWKTKGWELRRAGPGQPWEISIKLKKGTINAYSFVVDGESWLPDPASPERVDDGFGGSNSLLRI
jgi:hypothetical protein